MNECCEFCHEPIVQHGPGSMWWVTDERNVGTRWCLARERRHRTVGYHRPEPAHLR